ncbi:MAG: translesion DNA synthesis-associated protein ImuA [Steroidobacteraceae bacterium]
MPDAGTPQSLERLLQHPSLWRGRSLARTATFPSGFPALDAALPGGGWPLSGLIEVLIPQHGIGELSLWLPLIAERSARPEGRWCAFISPPHALFAPAFAAAGIDLSRLLIVHERPGLWSLEQALRSAACDLAFCWIERVAPRDLRRLALATEQGATPAVLFRPASRQHESSPACLRLLLTPFAQGLTVQLIKSRGGDPKPIELRFATEGE